MYVLSLGRRNLGVLFVLLVLALLLVNMKSAWALTVTPSSPIAGTSFTISGTTTTGGHLYVLVGYGCPGGGPAPVLVAAISSPTYMVTVPGHPAGQYSASADGDQSGCVNFNIDPAPAPSVYIPYAVGGVMLPSVGFTVLVPWIILLSLLGVVAVEAFTAKHRAKRR